MYPIVSKRPLNEAGTVLEYVIKAPLVAKKCLPGQFVILRLDEYGERVPLTIADYDREAGTVTISHGNTRFPGSIDGIEAGAAMSITEFKARFGTYIVAGPK